MTIFKLVELRGKMYHCECCGSYSSEGTSIYINDELVWEKYSDGHLGGHQTEESLLDCVLKGWNETVIKIIEEQHTEKARHDWNKKYPGNGIARTPESWKEQKDTLLEFQKQSFENVRKNCQNLPYDELLQLKMIALWIESDTGEKIQIVEDSVYEDDGLDDDLDNDLKY